MSFIMGALAWQGMQSPLMNSITTIFAFMSLTLNCFLASRPRYVCVCAESGGGRMHLTGTSFSPGPAQKAPLDCKKKDVQATTRKTLIHLGFFISSLPSDTDSVSCTISDFGLSANDCLYGL